MLSPVSEKNGGRGKPPEDAILFERNKERKGEKRKKEKKIDYKLALRAVAVKEKKKPALSSSGPVVKKVMIRMRLNQILSHL